MFRTCEQHMSCNCDIKDILHYDSKNKTLTIDQSVKLVVANKENGALQVAGGGEFNTSNSASTAMSVTGLAQADEIHVLKNPMKVDTIEGLTRINPTSSSGCLDTINNGKCGLMMDGLAGRNGTIRTGDWYAQDFLWWGDGAGALPQPFHSKQVVSILGGPSETVRAKDKDYYKVIP